MSEKHDTSVVVMVIMICLGLSFTAVVLRFVSRGLILKKVNADDWLIVLSWILSFGVSFSIYLGTTYGLGHDTLSKENQVLERKTQFVYTLLYHPALMTTKTSILLFYLSISQNFRVVQWGNWATLIVVNIGGLVMTFLVAFQCNPLSATFLADMPGTTRCIETYALIYASAPLNVITDLLILILPMPVLTSLRLPKKQKIILIAVFAGGGLTSIVSIIRIYFFERALAKEHIHSGITKDTHVNSWNGALSFMWSSVEINAGIICASVPMIKPLIAKLFPGCIGVSGSSGSASFGDTIDSTLHSTEFITFEPPKSAIALTFRESLKPFSLVTVLFFLWGFAYGFVNTINQRFEDLLNISVSRSLGLHSAYFSGYFAAPLLLSGSLLKIYGFRVTFIVGLCINGAGCLIFWPSAVLKSYAGFCVSMVVLGLGLATIELAANPFIVLCGPLKYCESRLCISQAFQAVGALIGPLVASQVLPELLEGETSLGGVQWVYLGIAFFVFLLAIAFYYSKIPEMKDTDFPTGPERHGFTSLWKGEYAVGFAWSVVAQFLYTGAQEIFSRFSGTYLGQGTSAVYSSSTTSHGLFVAGRFVAGFAMLALRPRYILLAALTGCTVTTAVALITQSMSTGTVMIQLIWFLESSIFPIVLATAIRGRGKLTKDGAKYQISSTIGAMLFPPLYYAVLKKSNPRYAMSVPLSLFSIVATYPIYLCTSSKERKRLDKLDCTGDVPEERERPIALQDIKPGRRQYLEMT
ncbi:uncharacterized protein H6S33_000439 [Morchella sextelata]|uniref:uncharacterized protein n=1 Tax=Morchella sextelata TaxID=1174677 RepID=UPI001D04D0CB|nr:uncharacterized protein H6S33_000439 [Morchella sextelata]KAH0614803.1 hypothetical protein H6S33_000439 [Morchella sextelata]